MNTFDQIAGGIIQGQSRILGSFAWQEAALVKDLKILDKDSGSVEIAPSADHGKVIDELVNQYVELFGRAARETSRESVAPLLATLPPAEVPSSLK